MVVKGLKSPFVKTGHVLFTEHLHTLLSSENITRSPLVCRKYYTPFFSELCESDQVSVYIYIYIIVTGTE